MMRLTALLMLCTACTSTVSREEPGGLSLRVTDEQVAPGDSVTLILANRSSQEAGYNLCPSTLAHEVGGEWVPVPSDRVCTMELRSLDPSGEDRITLEVPNDIEPGHYRFETTIVRFDPDTREPVRTDPFRVMD